MTRNKGIAEALDDIDLVMADVAFECVVAGEIVGAKLIVVNQRPLPPSRTSPQIVDFGSERSDAGEYTLGSLPRRYLQLGDPSRA